MLDKLDHDKHISDNITEAMLSRERTIKTWANVSLDDIRPASTTVITAIKDLIEEWEDLNKQLTAKPEES